MAKANYYLKNQTNEQGQNLIVLYFNYEGQRLVYSTGQTIDPKYWNKAEQRAKKTLHGYKTLNGYLDSLQAKILELYRVCLSEGKNPSVKVLKQGLDLFLSKAEQKRERSFTDYFNEFLQVKSSTLQYKTIQKYKTFLNTITAFSKQSGQSLDFGNHDVKLYEKYIAYRAEQGKSDETTSKEIALWKTFLHWATEREYNHNHKFIRQFKTFERGKDVLSLTDKELFYLYNFDLSHNKKLEQIKDAFLFSCFTGLRFSDVVKVNKKMVQGNRLTLHQTKTTNKVSIYLTDYALSLLQKNNYEFLAFGNYYYNTLLREVFKMVGLDREISKIKISGNKKHESIEPLYEVITFHVGRKTYVSLSLEKGVRHEVVMTQTGHRKLATLQKYINVNSNVIEQEISEAWQGSKPKLKRVQD